MTQTQALGFRVMGISAQATYQDKSIVQEAMYGLNYGKILLINVMQWKEREEESVWSLEFKLSNNKENVKLLLQSGLNWF